MAKAMLESVGARCTRYPFVEDNPEKIRDAVQTACSENDIVIVSAGSSAGTKDYTADVIAGLGKVLVHGIATRPGKPAIIGKVDKKPVFGLPGYPLSATDRHPRARAPVPPELRPFCSGASDHPGGHYIRPPQGDRFGRVRPVHAREGREPLDGLPPVQGCRCPDERGAGECVSQSPPRFGGVQCRRYGRCPADGAGAGSGECPPRHRQP